jgi:hypothetical protein
MRLRTYISIEKENEIINMVVIVLSHLRNIIEGLEQVVNV